MQIRVQRVQSGVWEPGATGDILPVLARPVICLFVPVILAPSHLRGSLLLSPLSSSVRDLPWPGSAAKPSQGWCLIVIVKYLDASARNKQSPQSLHNCHHHAHLISHSQDSHVVKIAK